MLMPRLSQFDHAPANTLRRLVSALVGLLATLSASTSCVVTGSPDFSPLERAAPKLIPVTPTAELMKVIAEGNNFFPEPFAAQVLSEDAGDEIETVLLVDYGLEGPGGEPWLAANVGSRVSAGTLADGPRDFSVMWRPQPAFADLRMCHTVTLVVTHEWNGVAPFYYCPADKDDAASLTWVVALCKDSASCGFEDCPVSGEDTFRYCGDAAE